MKFLHDIQRNENFYGENRNLTVYIDFEISNLTESIASFTVDRNVGSVFGLQTSKIKHQLLMLFLKSIKLSHDDFIRQRLLAHFSKLSIVDVDKTLWINESLVVGLDSVTRHVVTDLAIEPDCFIVFEEKMSIAHTIVEHSDQFCFCNNRHIFRCLI